MKWFGRLRGFNGVIAFLIAVMTDNTMHLAAFLDMVYRPLEKVLFSMFDWIVLYLAHRCNIRPWQWSNLVVVTSGSFICCGVGLRCVHNVLDAHGVFWAVLPYFYQRKTNTYYSVGSVPPRIYLSVVFGLKEAGGKCFEGDRSTNI